MGLDIGGYEQKPDWPKMGPSLLIASCMILAIRTAKWSVRDPTSTASQMDLEQEIEHAIFLAGRVLAKLVAHKESLFPRRREAWYIANDKGLPR